MAKTTVALGLMMSLIGGVAPRLAKANGNIEVKLKGGAEMALAFGKAKAAPKPTAKSTKVAVKKGDKTMNSIDTITHGVGKRSSLPGE